MSENKEKDYSKYIFTSVDRSEATYKRTGGLNVGISRGARVEDTENEVIIISLGERSQMGNKEVCLNYFEAKEQFQQAQQEVKELKPFKEFFNEDNRNLILKCKKIVEDTESENARMREALEYVISNTKCLTAHEDCNRCKTKGSGLFILGYAKQALNPKPSQEEADKKYNTKLPTDYLELAEQGRHEEARAAMHKHVGKVKQYEV